MLLAESLLGSSSTAANYIEDVFSTYLYTGNGSSQSIGNGIQLGAGATSPGWISLQTSSTATVRTVASDSSGNAYAGGKLSTNMHVVKYDSTGSILWQRQLAANTGSGTYSVFADSSGNVYICGDASGAGTNDFQIAKYNSSGTIQWQRRLGGTGSDSGYSVAVDSSGNVYVCGTMNGNGGAVLAKYDTSGTIQWQRRYSGGTADYGQAVAVDSSGNVYLAGRSYITSSYSGTIVKYDSSGTLQWQRSLGSSSSESFNALAIDSDNNIYVCGTSNVSSIIGIQIAKYNSSGTLQWQRRLTSSSGDSQGYSVAVDSSNNVYIGGAASSFGSLQIAKYNSSGTIQWQRQLTYTGTNYLTGIAIGNTGTVYVGGTVNSSSTLLAKLPDDGSGTGTYTINNNTVSYLSSSLTDAASSLTGATPSLTSSTSTLTDASTSYTDSASSIAPSSTTLVEGSAKGGMVWLKGRSGATDHALYDTARGATLDLVSNSTAAQTTQATGLTGFTANGFSIGALAKLNTNAATYASWTFRKQAKFFDIVTYTGDGSGTRNLSHSLTSVPGCVIAKRTDGVGDWFVWHRGNGTTNYTVMALNTAAAGSAYAWSSYFTSTTFNPMRVQNASEGANQLGHTYVAYLFAHDAGGFGLTGNDNVISCGSFTTDGSGNATVTLGYEPQWLLYKRVSGGTGNWEILDNMRGYTTTGTVNDAIIVVNQASAESLTAYDAGGPIATGFTAGSLSASSAYIYIAIRRGPMKTPTSGTSVFGLSARTGTGANATVTGGQTDDAVLIKNRGSAVGDLFAARLTGTGYMETSSTAAEVAAGTTILQANPWDVMDGVKVGTTSTITNASSNTFINYLFRRAPGFFDVVCYTGTGTALTQTINHNLTVTPELMIVKRRSTTGNWSVYTSTTGTGQVIELNSAYGAQAAAFWGSGPTSTTFQVTSNINNSGITFVAYLFASCPGVSKFGSYTGTGTTNQINCGFTNGARFVLIKRTDDNVSGTANWYVWDSARGIVSGNDPYLLLNSTAAEVTSTDYVDTYSAGFEISSTAPVAINASGGTFIFLAIA